MSDVGNSAGQQDRVDTGKAVERAQQDAQRLRVAYSLAGRMMTAPDGSRTFLRFTLVQCLEHQLLIVTFTALAVTGLLQRYSSTVVAGWIINSLFGGIDAMQVLHRLAAVVFMAQTVFHIAHVLYFWFVKREWGVMWPSLQDMRDTWTMARYKLDKSEERPDFGRFSTGEKLEYWAALWGGVVMILTGLIQWFPAEVTTLLPGDAVPVSRAVHGWEALLATLTVLTWHMYQNLIKKRNLSIFTGFISEDDLRAGHPKEYWRILAAHNYLQIRAMERRRINQESVEEKNKEDGTF